MKCPNDPEWNDLLESRFNECKVFYPEHLHTALKDWLKITPEKIVRESSIRALTADFDEFMA